MTRSLSDRLNALAESGALDARALTRARELAGITPGIDQWRTFLDRVLLIGGALFIAVAAIFFVAHNWEHLGRFGKIALLAALVTVSAAIGIVRGPSTAVGQAGLLAATLATGALLAFIGQTYQTGADPWQLFAAWAVLCVPWALAANTSLLWAVLLVIANVAVGLYAGQARPSWFGGESFAAFNAIALVNGVALVLAEWREGSAEPGRTRILPRLAGIGLITAATLSFLVLVIDGTTRHAANLLVFLVVIPACYYAYAHVRRDLLLLAAVAYAVVAALTGIVARILSWDSASTFGFLLVALVLIGLSAAAANWLRTVARKWEGR